MSDARSPLVIFGCGYVGGYLARAAIADGQRVRACARNANRLAPLAELGVEVRAIDAAKNKQFGPALLGLLAPTVVYSIPPVPGMPGGEAVRRATQAALNAGARAFIYIGSAGVYGTTPSAEWVDEDTSVELGDSGMSARHADEGSVQTAAAAGLRATILRLPAIYGPGRGVRARLRKGDYEIVGDGELWFSRIHVLDLVTVIRAAADLAPGGPRGTTFCVGDDRPTQQKEYVQWLSAHLGLPMPPSTPLSSTSIKLAMKRGRRIRNERVKQALSVTLAYPSFVEGEKQIDEAEEAEKAAALAAAAAAEIPPTR